MPLTESVNLVLANGQKVPNDPFYSFTSLLLHGDGTNGSTTIRDNSSSPKTVTAVGNAQISTAQTRTGFGQSVFFNNSNTNRLAVSPTADFVFGTGNFTVEAWVYLLGQTSYMSLLEIGNHQASAGIIFLLGSDSNGGVYSGAFYGTRMTTITDQWLHVAFCRNLGTLRGFVNGSQVFTVAFTNNLSDASTVTIGYAPAGAAQGSNLYNFNGYIDDLRITKGVARYTSNFTPPTAPFPDF